MGASFEDSLGETYLQVAPDYAHLKEEMLDYAEASLCRVESGRRRLTLFVNDFDDDLERIAAASGYVKAADSPQVTARLDIAGNSLTYLLPKGFELTNRRESNDLRRINRVLWRGFDHDGPAPEKYVAGRADVEKAPLFRKDLISR